MIYFWSDPVKDATDYDENDRGVSAIFGEKIVMDFNKKNDLDLLIKAHQVVDDGYDFLVNRQLITIFLLRIIVKNLIIQLRL